MFNKYHMDINKILIKQYGFWAGKYLILQKKASYIPNVFMKIPMPNHNTYNYVWTMI